MSMLSAFPRSTLTEKRCGSASKFPKWPEIGVSDNKCVTHLSVFPISTVGTVIEALHQMISNSSCSGLVKAQVQSESYVLNSGAVHGLGLPFVHDLTESGLGGKR